jgi:hypothetical protein
MRNSNSNGNVKSNFNGNVKSNFNGNFNGDRVARIQRCAIRGLPASLQPAVIRATAEIPSSITASSIPASAIP